MSSTSSSTEREIPALSATEVLASRYRHLFVLPSTARLLAYAAVVTLVLCLFSRGLQSAVPFILTLGAFILSSGAVSSAAQVSDKATIANFRRTSAVLLGGEVLWVFCVALGAAYQWIGGSSHAVTNAFVFGAFACAGFEFLVIYGAFTANAPLAIALATIHPASTLVLVRFAELSNQFDIVAFGAGVSAFLVIAGFTALLKRKKTSKGYDSLGLFRSFMKTWAGRRPEELETAISAHAVTTKVDTEVLRLQTNAGSTFLVLPGVHPGPFHPIGSYDLPGVISKSFLGLGPVMTLHRPGGHENNLASASETQRFASQVLEFAREVKPAMSGPIARGPLHSKVGEATLGAMALSTDLLLTISFAPRGSDDLSSEVEERLSSIGSQEGVVACVVDAHNSIDNEQQHPQLDDPGWKEGITSVLKKKPTELWFAYAHSKELAFPRGEDLTENGVGLALFRVEGINHALVLADANNSVPALRAEVEAGLSNAGFRLLEFCTSDSHNLAARGLTVARGYKALGEQTPVPTIVDLVVNLAKRASGRLAPANYGSGRMSVEVKVFGAKALEEFANLTQASSRLGRRYLRFAAISTGALLAISIIL